MSKGSKQVRVALSPDEWRALETEARFNGRTISEHIAHLIRLASQPVSRASKVKKEVKL